MRSHNNEADYSIANIDHILIDGEFDEYDNITSLNAAFHAEMEDSWSDEELMDMA